jgi:uncharacterized membrane protein
MIYFVKKEIRMDGILYPASLILIALLAFTFNRSNNNILMIIVLAIGIYIIYSHETGHTATDFKNEMIESIDESAEKFSKSHGTERYNEKKIIETVK